MKYNPDCKLSQSLLSGQLLAGLMKAGFREVDPGPRCKERVFERPRTENGTIRVVVFTSIHVNRGLVRDRGHDAIRVCLVRKTKDGTDRGLVKVKRVNRVGEIDDIVKRTLDRMRLCWVAIKEVSECPHCGAPEFITKAGKTCCSELCFKNKPGYPRYPNELPDDRRSYRRRY